MSSPTLKPVTDVDKSPRRGQSASPYLELFELREHPFRLTPDPYFLYLSDQHARAKAYLESTLWFSDGFVVITGEIGSGKTTLIEKFLSELGEDVVIARLSQTQLTPVQLLQGILAEFGFKPFNMRKAELLNRLNSFLGKQYAGDRKVVLVIDEAQNLSPRVLEELRLLSGVENVTQKVLSIILAGQPELNGTLDSPQMEQLAQRTRLRFHLQALSEEETRNYVHHRLQVAAGDATQIFAEECFAPIFRYTGGIPRLINTLCDTAMLAAFVDDTAHVNHEFLRQAIDELQWVEYTARTNQMAAGFRDLQSVNKKHLGTLRIALSGKTMGDYPLTPGRLIIGRTSDNDLQLDSKYISRHHAQVVTSDRHSILEDLNSTNGVYVGKRRIKKHRLRDGDQIHIGRHQLDYHDEREAVDTTIAESPAPDELEDEE